MWPVYYVINHTHQAIQYQTGLFEAWYMLGLYTAHLQYFKYSNWMLVLT